MSWSDVCGKLADKVTRDNIISFLVTGMLAWIIHITTTAVPGKLDVMISQQAIIITKLDDCSKVTKVAYRPKEN